MFRWCGDEFGEMAVVMIAAGIMFVMIHIIRLVDRDGIDDNADHGDNDDDVDADDDDDGGDDKRD